MLKISLYIFLGMALAALLRWGFLQFYSFGAQQVSQYAEQGPKIDIRQALSGPMQAEGVIFDFAGRATSRFTATMQGDWLGNVGQLSESFLYSSGTRQHRQWQLEITESGEITGMAPDIIGVARGQQSGPVVHLRYRLMLPEAAGGHVIDVIDWMYLTRNGTIMNKAEFRKFGIKVGEMLATFRKVE